ncbi:DUF4296 domain-containing protein [Formosa maritima]|uniref:DUF4296 domain-containing protein n=2 Tax=Formosa maritima TaxID=2592046 RepID=A0A5D0G2G8_9FLAO|nr:DUF4296 domain-containing protein [Formosa maritima]
MKNSLTYILLVCFCISCSGNKKIKKPENLMSKNQMVNVLIDMSFLTSAKGINKTKIEENGIVPESYVYAKHNIDSLQFIESNAYYTYNLKEYQDIINRVTDSLNKLRDEYNVLAEEDEKEKKKQDSIKRSKRKNKGFLLDDSQALMNKD